MEILYFWVEKYRNFVEQGFNFSSEYIFTLEKDPQSLSYDLSVKKNPRFIPDFFKHSNISNISAIIGQNGSGKTSVLELIKTHLPSFNQEWETRGIIAFRNEKGVIVLIPRSMDVKFADPPPDFIPLKYPDPFPKETGDYWGSFYDDAMYVYYSNIVDLKIEENFLQGFMNLSTLALIKDDNFIQEESKNLTRDPEIDSFSKYKANEIRRNVQFILSDDRNLLPFPLPEFLFIDCLDADRKILVKEDPDVSRLMDQFKTTREDLINQVYTVTMLNTLFTYRKRSSLIIPIKIRPMKSGESIKGYVIDFFENLKNILYQDEYKQISGIERFRELSELTIPFFELLEDLFEKKIIEIENNPFTNGMSLRFAIRTDTEASLKTLLDYYIRIKGVTDFFDFNWRSVSSGQQSFFTLLSRFYHLKISESGIPPSMIILIDEGDIYFHPQWQKEFFDKTINFLSRLFPAIKLQFIFASNTPFITSDLPRDNVIFIENIESSAPDVPDRILVHGIENGQRETFAGNIHTLFADSFYMKGALIGDFAKNRIDSIINYLRDTKATEQRQDYKQTIEIIGEPILKERLLQMWDAKFGTEEQIAFLQERIKILQKKQ